MENWITSWAISHTGGTAFGLKLSGRTAVIRAMSPLGGSRLRLVLANPYGKRPVKLGAAAVKTAAGIAPVTFSGDEALVLGPGARAVSDPVPLAILPGEEAEVRLYYTANRSVISGNVTAPASHSPRGNYCLSERVPREQKGIWAWPIRPFSIPEPAMILQALEVAAPSGSAVAVLGDSNSFNGFYTKPLGERLSGEGTALLNMSISGNRLRLDSAMPLVGNIFGFAAGTRADWDLYALRGVKAVFLNVGGNDIFQPGTASAPKKQLCTPEELLLSTETLAAECRRRGYLTIGATLVPALGAEGFGEEKLALAKAFNALVRQSDCFDALVDVYDLLQDPEHPGSYHPAYDTGDHLHFNEAGGTVVAEAVYQALKRIGAL